MISRRILDTIVFLWLVLETGQFESQHLTWGDNILFWPLWLALSLTVILGTLLLDERLKQTKDNGQSKKSDRSR